MTTINSIVKHYIITGEQSDGRDTWIWVEHICSLTRADKYSVIRTVDGHTFVMKDNPETILKTIQKLMEQS